MSSLKIRLSGCLHAAIWRHYILESASCLCVGASSLDAAPSTSALLASYIMRTMDSERTGIGRTLASDRSEDEVGFESDWLHQARIAREHARRRLESHAAQPAESRGPANNFARGEFWIQTRRYLFEQERLFDETQRTIHASEGLNVGRT